MKKLIVLLLFAVNLLFAQSWNQMTKIVASDRGVNARFSNSVSISGEYAIVGAPWDDKDASGKKGVHREGSAYIFKLLEGEWAQAQKITALDREAGSWFGWSVSISGNYAIVGAMYDDRDEAGENSIYNSGAAYIFELNDGKWTQMQKIVAADRSEYLSFGYSVAISGNYAVVGAHSVTKGKGSAYVFSLTDDKWSQMQKLSAEGLTVIDDFSSSVAISGNYVIVGRDGDKSAYIYELSDGKWIEMQKITASDGVESDDFGCSVSISDNYLVVGAYGAYGREQGMEAGTGAAYIYELSDGKWEQIQKLVASDHEANSYFGCSVAISGNYAIVGANGEGKDVNGNTPLYKAGAAYIFQLTKEGKWIQVQKITAFNRDKVDEFGYSVSIASPYAIVGANQEDQDALDNNTMNTAGSAYIFVNDAAK